jgi:hypothetical protein
LFHTQAQENEGGHTFTEPSQTNQRTDIDRKVSSVTKRNDVYKIMTTLQEEKLGLYRRNCELKYVSDYHFLMLLLPYMQQVSPDRKMYVRLKLPMFLMRKKYQKRVSSELSSLTK